MMSDASDDPGVPGGGLPEVVQRRLARLEMQLNWLLRLAQPYAEDPLRKWTSQARQQELAAGLEAAVAQLDLVLDDVLQPSQRRATAAGPDAPESTPPAAATDDAGRARQGRPFVFGVTVDQVDTLDRLIRMIRAYGDVVSADDMADFAEGTLVMVGHALFNGALDMREVLDQVQDQRLREPGSPPSLVAEARAVYVATAAAVPGMRGAPAHRRLEYIDRPGGLSLN
jgi:hypothetical protein